MRALKVLGIFTIAAGIVAGLYFYYINQNKGEFSLEAAIPVNALYVIKLKPGPAELRAIRANPTAQLILAMQSDHNVNQYIDELRDQIALNSELFSLMQNRSLFISAHMGSAGTIDYLYSIKIGKNDKLLIGLLEKEIGIQKNMRIVEGNKIFEYPVNGRTFALVNSDGLLAASFSPILVEQFSRNIGSKNAKIFNKQSSDPIRFFADSKNIQNAGRFFFEKEFKTGTNARSGKVTCTKDLLVFESKIAGDEVNHETYSNAKHFDPIIFNNAFPSTTAHFNIYAVSSFSNEYRDQRNHDSIGENKLFEIDQLAIWDSLLLPVVAKVILRPADINYRKNSFVVLTLADNSTEKPNFLLDSGSELYANGESYTLYNLDERDSEIINLLIDENDNEYRYAFIADNRVVFGKYKDALSAYSDALSRERFAFNEIFQTLEIADQQWLEFGLSSMSRSEHIIKAALKSDYFNAFIASHKLNDGPAFIFRGTYKQGTDFIKEFRGGGKEHSGKGLNVIQSIALDDLVATRAICSFDGSDHYYFIQDESNQLYCINEAGDANFSINTENKILSGIHEVDYFENGKTQYLFNTATALFLVDKNGKNIGNYPIGLPDTSRSGLCFADHSSIRNPKYFLPCGNRIYAYDVNGRRSSDFKYLASSSEIVGNVSYFHFKGKNYIVFKDMQGYAYVMDLSGNLLAKSDKKEFSPLSDFYSAGLDESYAFITSDINGNILRMKLNGEISEISNNVFSSAHIFNAADLDHDLMPEFIFIEGNELTVYTSDMVLITMKLFDQELAPWIEVFENSDGEYEIACASLLNSEIYLVKQDGELHEGFPIQGEKGFDISLSVEKEESVLITGLGRYLKVYSFN